jgi:hypothetical protein
VRDQNPPPVFFWTGILTLTVLLAGLALGSIALPADPAQSPTATPSRTTTSTPAAAPLLSDSRGFIVQADGAAPASLRRETSGEAFRTLRGSGFIGAVSSTGRRIAYWLNAGTATRELRVFDAIAPEEDTALATVTDLERGGGIAWASDRTGLLLVVESSGIAGPADPTGPFSALRVIDVPTRTIREIARISGRISFWPVGWDRDSGLTGACIHAADGMGLSYVVTGEDALSTRVPMEPGIPVATVQSNGKAVLGVLKGVVIRVWNIASYQDHLEFGASQGETIAFARWKPGADEIVVSVADRLEIWPAAGGERRVIARGLPVASDLLVSADAGLAFVTFDQGRGAVAVDLATGRTAPVPMAGGRLVASLVYR